MRKWVSEGKASTHVHLEHEMVSTDTAKQSRHDSLNDEITNAKQSEKTEIKSRKKLYVNNDAYTTLQYCTINIIIVPIGIMSQCITPTNKSLHVLQIIL